MHTTGRSGQESARDFALRTLKENIVLLDLAPGSMVSETELASELGLSRTPVREALIELSRVGIVEIFPQRGSRIALVDYELVEEAQFMRETLECAVVERCASMEIPPVQLDMLEENLKLQDFYLQNRHHKLLELDNAFHRQLFSIARRLQVYTLMNSMTVHFDRIRAMSLTAVRELKLVEDHHAILSAVMQHDATLARSVMHKHLNRYQIDRAAIAQQYAGFMKSV